MALSRNEAPVYGGNTLKIEFPKELMLSRDASYYVVYCGSHQRDVAGARPLSDNSLHSIVPAHNEAEYVQVNVYSYYDNQKCLLATSRFCFYHDPAFYMSQFLIESVYNPAALEDLELIKSDHFDLSNEDLSTLDQRLSRALVYLDIPDFWTLLGSDSEEVNPTPRETLLHFSARLGLTRVATFFLSRPGSQIALRLSNHHGYLPRDVALNTNNAGLAELLSEYNVHGLPPLCQRYVMDKGTVQTHETGDISLTSKLGVHPKSIESENLDCAELLDDDVHMLQDIKLRMEQHDHRLRQWQTDWPDNSQQHLTQEGSDLQQQIEQKVETIYKKTQDIQNIVTMETDNYQDNPNANLVEGSDTNYGVQSHVEISSTQVVPGEETFHTNQGNLPQLYISEESLQSDDGKKVLEGPVSALRDYNEHLLRIREKSGSFQRILDQDLRKENLSRFSSSCPSLDADVKDFPKTTIDEEDRHKSLVDLVEDVDEPSVTISYSEELFPPSTDSLENLQDRKVQHISGVTVDESTDKIGTQTLEYDSFLKEYYGGNIPNVRRRSWHPDDLNLGAEQSKTSSPSMLAGRGKSMSLNSLDDEEESEDESFQDMVDGPEQEPSSLGAGAEGRRRDLRSAGDAEGISMEEEQSGLYQQDASNVPKRLKPRGPGGSTRYSADIEQLEKAMTAGQASNLLTSHQSASTPQSGNSTEEESGGLQTPHTKMTKALSMSSIPMTVNAEGQKGGSPKKALSRESKHLWSPRFTFGLNFGAQFRRQKGIEEDVEEGLAPLPNTPGDRANTVGNNRRKGEVSLIDFLNDPGNFKDDQRLDKKEEKSRKKSVFSRFHSTRTKKKDKDKNRQTISFSDQQSVPRQTQLRASVPPGSQGGEPTPTTPQHERMPQSAPIPVSNVRSYSFKEKRTGLTPQQVSVPPSGGLASTPPADLSQIATANLHRRSLPTPRRIINEEGESDSLGSGPDLDRSNIGEASSQSLESLDEVDSTQEVRYDDSEIQKLDMEEAETWSATVDKKTLKKFNIKDIKRQDTIWELIQTERHHCKTLLILQQMFRNGLIRELHMSQDWVDRLFPNLDDLIDIHMTFLSQLQDLQAMRPDRSIDDIGNSLINQFKGEPSDRMKVAYGAFCSGHKEAVQMYKDQLNKDPRFSSFIKRCCNHQLCKKREIPDFILLITQRLTKYPTLIEAILKSTKDKKDRENLSKALRASKEVLENVDEQVADYERQLRLRDIWQRMDRSTAVYRGKKFKKSDLTNPARKMLHEGTVGWKTARGKNTEVIAVVLTDVMFFMQESNQKYAFFTQDNKQGVISLYNLLVREKGDTRDSKGIYLISQSKQNPEMYELVCRSSAERHHWIKVLRTAVEKCPEEEEEVPSEAEEERRRQDDRMARARQIMEQLRQKDELIKQCCDDKNRLMLDLLAVYSGSDDLPNSRPGSREFDEDSEQAGAMQIAIHEASMAVSQLTSMFQGNGSTNLSRHVSSVGEHVSSTYASLHLPKRAETFAGFDSIHDVPKVPIVTKKDEADSSSPMSSLYSLKRDESDLDITSPCQDMSGSSYSGRYEHEVDSGRGSSPGGFSSASTLSPVQATQEQLSLAQVISTLNSLVHLTASQGTKVENLRSQLAEANERINRLSADVHEKKSGYKHTQLEELRNLQEQIRHEKQAWEKQKEKETSRMEAEYSHVEERKRQLDRHEAELKAQKEELRKQREVFQRQIDMLHEQGKLAKDSGTSHMSRSEGKSSQQQQSGIGSVQSEPDNQSGHRRSASAEFINNAVPSDLEKLRKSGPKPKESFRTEQRPLTHLQSFSSASSRQTLPEHLLSAKNEQKMGSKNVQKIPSKLSSMSSSSLPSQSSNSNLPLHLAKASPHSGGGNHGNSSIPHNYSGSELCANTSGHSEMIHSASGPQLGIVGNGSHGNREGHTPPSGGKKSNKPSAQSSMQGLSLVMKLAEPQQKGKSPEGTGESSKNGQRPKSGGPRQAQGTNINHKPQKSDSDVIYF